MAIDGYSTVSYSSVDWCVSGNLYLCRRLTQLIGRRVSNLSNCNWFIKHTTILWSHDVRSYRVNLFFIAFDYWDPYWCIDAVDIFTKSNLIFRLITIKISDTSSNRNSWKTNLSACWGHVDQSRSTMFDGSVWLVSVQQIKMISIYSQLCKPIQSTNESDVEPNSRVTFFCYRIGFVLAMADRCWRHVARDIRVQHDTYVCRYYLQCGTKLLSVSVVFMPFTRDIVVSWMAVEWC